MSENTALSTQEQATRPLQEDQAENEIDLLELFYKLVENIKYIILAAVIGALLAGGYVYFMTTPMYEATSELYVLSSNDSAINLSDLQIGSYLTKDYQEIFNTWEVHETINRNLGLNYSYGQLRGMLSITNPTDTRILKITVESADPAEAQMLANEYATVARTYIAEKMGSEMPSVLSNALLPTAPVSPNKTRTVMLGFLGGMLLAAAIIVVVFIMDDKIKSAEDIRKYADLPTLAIVPVMKSMPGDTAVAKSRRRKA